MRNLKRTEMQEHSCIYCKYYDHWSCKLNTCYMDNEDKRAATMSERSEHSQAAECNNCAYKKQGGCNGYCMRKALSECKVIWNKTKSKDKHLV